MFWALQTPFVTTMIYDLIHGGYAVKHNPPLDQSVNLTNEPERIDQPTNEQNKEG